MIDTTSKGVSGEPLIPVLMSHQLVYWMLEACYNLVNKLQIHYSRDIMLQSITLIVLTPDRADTEINIWKYAVLWTDRKEKSHDEIAMYLHEDLIALILLSYSHSICEKLIAILSCFVCTISAAFQPAEAPNHMVKFEDCLTIIEAILVRLDQCTSYGELLKWPKCYILSGMMQNEK